jgi:ribonuclease HI
MLVWQKIWGYISNWVHQIFTASIELGFYPEKWKTATIVVLRKPGKPDYTVPGAYRPISLLNTLGKLLEAVMARRLAFYAETYGLLPETQFGGRVGRTTEQALLVLVNAIDRAWLRSKVVTLVAFDLKGAFNGVNKITLDARLKEKGIPTKARKWIRSFMEDRFASIKFDDFQTQVERLENAGLAQGSPLSPILFILFNSDLVDQSVNFDGGASAFIDDYFLWKVGRSAEENLRKIQEEDIPRIAKWARRTGSCFAIEKTELIHLTRKKSELGKGQIEMEGKAIKASPTAKLLGVVFDQELRWKDHVQKAIQRATKACTAIGGLRHLRPTQMKQLYQACVVPILDYASTVWHNPLKDKMHLRALNTVQRVALIRILSSFRTVATLTLEVEAYIPPTRLRLRQRGQNTVAKLYTLPKAHPIQSVIERSERRINAKGNDPKFPLVQTLKTMDLAQLQTLEKIDPKPLEPWRKPTFGDISIAKDRESTTEKAIALLNNPDTVIYADAAVQKPNIGAAAVILDQQKNIKRSVQANIGISRSWPVHAAKLISIHKAIQLVMSELRDHQGDQQGDTTRKNTYTIVSGSKAALQAIKCPSNKSGQNIVHNIISLTESLKQQQIKVHLVWIPGRSSTPGNEAAYKLAKNAAGPSQDHEFGRPLPYQKVEFRRQMLKEWQQEWQTSDKGKHLRKLDDGLPAKRTQRLYGPLQRHQTYLLTQLRTGHAWLATYAKLHRFSDEDKCECGARETVVHILVDCPKLCDVRQQLREKIGDAFNNIADMLGGKSENMQGKATKWSFDRSVLNAVIDFANASKRFQSRSPHPRQ